MGKKKKPDVERPIISQEEEKEKACIKCNEIKKLSRFKKRNQCKDGHINQVLNLNLQKE